MDESTDDRRWAARRKFWFPSGILVDRRAGLERRSGDERRTEDAPPPIDPHADRRRGEERRGDGDRRSVERRQSGRRPTDRAPD